MNLADQLIEIEAVRAACDGVTVGFVRDYSYIAGTLQEKRVLCAEQILTTNTLPDIFEVDGANNIIRRETPVLLPDGRLGKLVIHVWN